MTTDKFPHKTLKEGKRKASENGRKYFPEGKINNTP